MNLNTEQQINLEVFKQRMNKILFDKKETQLISAITSFLKSGKQYCPKFEKVGAFLAEFNYYYDLEYIVVCHHLCQYPLTKMIKFDVSDPADGLVISELATNFYYELGFPKSDNELEFLSIIREANGKFFSRCWQKANEETKLYKLCFVEIHECYSGYDSETGIHLNENQIDEKVSSWVKNFY